MCKHLPLGQRLHRWEAMGDKSCDKPSTVFFTFVKVKRYVYEEGRGPDSHSPKTLYLIVQHKGVEHTLWVVH